MWLAGSVTVASGVPSVSWTKKGQQPSTIHAAISVGKMTKSHGSKTCRQSGRAATSELAAHAKKRRAILAFASKDLRITEKEKALGFMKCEFGCRIKYIGGKRSGHEEGYRFYSGKDWETETYCHKCVNSKGCEKCASCSSMVWVDLLSICTDTEDKDNDFHVCHICLRENMLSSWNVKAQ